MKKFFNRTIVLLLALTMILTAVPIFTASAEIIVDVGDTVEYGSYPQSEVTDDTLKAALSALAGSTDNWTSYGYYSGTGNYGDGKMTVKDYMKYTDVTLNGQKYRGVYFTEYRPICTGYTVGSSYQDDNGYETLTQYWFKFEPIKWRVLDPETGLVMAQTILDSQAYSNYLLKDNDDGEFYGDESKTYYANNWATSSIRSWLNNDFLNTAFSSAEQNGLKSASLKNTAFATLYSKYDGTGTEDSVFLLSYSDALNEEYGFYDDSSRTAEGSAYAKCQGLYVNFADGTSYWRLRTAGSSSLTTCNVYCSNGTVYYRYFAYSACGGIRPAVMLNFLIPTENPACRHSYRKTTVPATCTEKGYTTYTCSKCGNTYNSDYTDATGHSYGENVTVTLPTCTGKGAVQKTCSVCGDVVKTSIDALGHVDADNDNVCDNCGSEINHSTSGKCTHMCHSNSKIVRFVWKICNFFNKLFNVQQKCACGAKHW